MAKRPVSLREQFSQGCFQADQANGLGSKQARRQFDSRCLDTFCAAALPKAGLAEDLDTRMQDGLYLVPTAEVPVTNIHRDEIIPAERLPIRYVAYSPCFRREAGAAGRQTRGILRVHQFDKVEMFSSTLPEHSWDEHERLRDLQRNGDMAAMSQRGRKSPSPSGRRTSGSSMAAMHRRPM